jgi:tetratricopeptide (TPR) repeat protein
LIAWLLATGGLANACASRAPAPLAAELEADRLRTEADRRLLDGCYECLQAAREAYERLVAGPWRARHVGALFEVSLLLALRERELAIDSSGAIARARALAAELPPGAEAGRYLEIAENIPADGGGVAERDDAEFRRSRAAFIRRIPELAKWLESGTLRPEVREYLSLSMRCKYLPQPRRPDQATEDRPAAPGGVSPPLLLYRRATCDELVREPLLEVRAAVPAFTEVAYFLALIEVAGAERDGAPGARPLLGELDSTFPASASVAYLNAQYNQIIGDCQPALGHFDRTIRLVPLHERALLGRAICLVQLNRHEEAVSTASAIIESALSNASEAHYWRAFVRYAARDLAGARADIDAAKALGPTRDIHRLAGIIEHDQEELVPSRRDLLEARNAPDGSNDCIARWYLGMVAYKEGKWIEAGEAMEDAMRCYERVRTLSEAARRRIEPRTDLDAVFKDRQLASLAATAEQCRSQYFAGAFNGATYYARAGNLEKARSLLDVAAKAPELATRVEELRKAIGGRSRERGLE